MTDVSTVWIVIPAFNEGKIIGKVVSSLTTKYPHVVVVDDGSQDNTVEKAAAAGATILRHPINLGQGASIQTGIKYALREGAAFIVTFDADGQHLPEDIARLLRRQAETKADVVIGSRFLGTASDIPPLRKLFLRLAVLFTRGTSGIKVTDAHNGLRIMTRNAAQQIRIRQNRMAHASEIIDQIASLNLSFAEEPVRIIYTDYSLQKGQKLSNSFNILWELTLARLRK